MQRTCDLLLSNIPMLRAFARSLCANESVADDIVQETLFEVLSGSSPDTEAVKLRASLFSIMRQVFFKNLRAARWEVQDDDAHAAQLAICPSQFGHMDFEDFCLAFEHLPEDERKALFLVSVSGYSCKEAAEECGCSVGTLRGRVRRAQSKVGAELSVESAQVYGPESTWLGVVQARSESSLRPL